ncbi:hypothetical protein FNF27_02901 [Cafeteria roenbergensis]|uniref:Uncharacterized protein n=1 Tax=Cafeteria roenbergensis TaxID=33653 RepID=A0A5A8EE04_CAFRO|nr:hypothetical protein FNF27_02901 [Cafeteria roenbergensis]
MPCGAGRLSSLWYCCCPKGGRTRNTYSAVTAVGFFVLVAIIVVQQLALINGVKNSLETVLRDQVAVVAMLRKLDRVTLLHAAIVAASDPGLTMAAHAGAKDSTDPWKLSVNWTVAEWTSSQAAASQALVAFGRRHGAEIGFLHDAAGAQRAATHRAALDEMGVSLEHETPLLDAAHDLYARAETGALHFRFGEYDPSGAVSFGAAGGAEAIAPGGGEAPRSLELGQDTKLRQGAVVEAASGWHARAPAAGASMTAILHHAKHLEASRVSRPLLDSAGLRGQTSRLSPQATQTNALASIAMAPVWSPGIRAAGTLDPLDLLPEVDRATLRAAYAATGPGGFFEPFASMAVAQVASIEDAIHQSPFDPTLPAVLSGAAMVTANNAVCARGVPQPRPPPRAGGSAPTPCLVSLPRGFLGAGPAAAGVLSVSRTHSGRLDTLARVSNAFSLGWTAYAHDSGHADALAEDRTAAFPWFLAGAYSTSVLRYNPSGAPGQNTPAWSPGLAAHGSPLDRSTLYPLMPLLDAPAGSWQPAELSNIDQLNASTVPPFLRDVLAPAAMLAPTLSGPLRVVAINQLILAQGLQPVPGIRFSLGNISMSLRALTRLYATESAREYGLSAVELSRVNAEIMVNTSAVDLVQGLKAFKQCSAAAGPVDDAAQRRLHVLCSSPLVDGLPLGIVGYVDALLHSQALTRLANWQIAEAVSSSVLVSDNDAAPVTSSSTVTEDDMSLRRPFIVDNGIALGGVEAVREHDARQRFFRLQKRPDALVATLTADTVQALVRSDPVAAQLKILEVEPSGLTRWAGALAAAARLPEAPVRHYHEDSSSRAITAFAVDQTDWLSSATPLFGATTLDNIATGRQVPAMAVRAMPRALIADLFYSRLLMTVLTSVAVLLLFVAFQRCTAVILVTPIEFVAKATLLAAAGRPSIVPLWRIRTATTRSLGLLGAQAAAEATQSKTARKARQLGGSRPVRARLVPAAAVVGSVQQVVSEAGADGERFKDDEAARAYDVMLELRALGDRLGAPGLVPARERIESVQARKARRRPDALAASAAGAAAGEALLMGGVAMGPRVVGPMPDKSSPSGRGSNRPSLVDRTAVGSDASAGGTPGVMMERTSVSSHDPTANRARGRTDIVPFGPPDASTGQSAARGAPGSAAASRGRAGGRGAPADSAGRAAKSPLRTQLGSSTDPAARPGGGGGGGGGGSALLQLTPPHRQKTSGFGPGWSSSRVHSSGASLRRHSSGGASVSSSRESYGCRRLCCCFWGCCPPPATSPSEVGGGDGSVSDVEGHFVPVKPFSLFTCIWRDLLLCRFCVRSTQNWSVARKERFRTFLFLGLAAVVVGINAFATTVVLLGVFRSALGQEAAVADAVVASRLDALRHSAAAAAAIPAIRTTASAALCASGGLATPGPFGALAVCNSSDPDARRDASDWSTKATPAAASLLATLTDVLSFDVVALAGADSRLLACPPDPAWRLAAGVAIKAGAAPPPLTVCGGLDPAELGGGGLAVPAPARGLIHAAVLYGRAVSAPMLLDGKWLAARGVRPRFGRRHLRTPQPKAEHHPIASFSNSTPPDISGYRGCPEAEATTLALCAAVPVEGLPRGFWVLGTDGPESGVNSTQDARGRPKQEGRRLDEGGSRAATAAAQPGATDGRFYPDPPEWGQLPRGVPPGGAYTSVLDVDEDSAAAGTAWQESPAAVAPSGAGDEHSLPRAWTAGVVLACDVLDGKTTLLEDMVAPLRERSTLLYKLVRRKGRAGGASRGDLFVSGLDHGLLEAEARAAAAAPAAGSDAAAAGWARVVPPVPGASLAADEAGESVPGEEGRRRLTPGEARLASAVWAFASGLVVTGEEPNDTGADSGAASAVQATLDGAGAEQTEGHWRTAMLRGEPVAFTARSLAAASIGGRSAPFWWPPNRISDEGASTPRPPPQEGAEAIEAGVGGAVVPARESTGVVVWATHLRRARGIVAFVLENLALAVVIVAIIEFRAAFLLGGRVQGPLASAVRRAERLATFAKTALATVDALRAHIGAGSLAKADMDRIQRVKALRVAHERHSPQGAPRKHRRGGSGGSTAGSQPADGSVDLSGSRSGGGAGHTDAWPAGPRVASPPADADADAVAGGAVPRSRSRTAIGAGPGSGGGASSSPLQTNRGRAVSVPSASGRPSPTNGSLAAPRVLEGGSGAMTAAEAASAAAQPRYRSSRAVSVHSPRVPAEDGLGRAFADLSTVRASGSVLGLFHHAGSRAPSSRRPDAWYRRRGAGQGSAARDELMERSAQFQDCDVFEVAGAPMRLQAGQLLSGQRGLSSHSTRQSTVGDDTTDHSQPDGIYSSRVVHEDGQPVVLLGPSYSDRDAAAVAPTGHGDVMRGGTLRTPATLGPPSSDAGDGSARGELVAARVESTPGGMDALATDALKGKGGTITADQLVPELAGTQNEVDWLVLFFEAATRPAEEDDSWMYGGVAKGRKIVKQS